MFQVSRDAEKLGEGRAALITAVQVKVNIVHLCALQQTVTRAVTKVGRASAPR